MSRGRRTRDSLVMLPRIRRDADAHAQTRGFAAKGRSKVRFWKVASNPTNTVFDAKRLIGRKFQDSDDRAIV